MFDAIVSFLSTPLFYSHPISPMIDPTAYTVGWVLGLVALCVGTVSALNFIANYPRS